MEMLPPDDIAAVRSASPEPAEALERRDGAGAAVEAVDLIGGLFVISLQLSVVRCQLSVVPLTTDNNSHRPVRVERDAGVAQGGVDFGDVLAVARFQHAHDPHAARRPAGRSGGRARPP